LETVLASAKKAWDSPERKWLVQMRSPQDIWQENPSYLAVEVLMYFWAWLTIKHGTNHHIDLYVILYCTVH